MSAVQLVKYEAARQALALVQRVDEAKTIRDKAEAMRVYARQAQDRELIAFAAAIKLRAERRAGELLREMAANGTRQTKAFPKGHEKDSRRVVSSRLDTTPKLKDLGLTRDQSSMWQRLAAVPTAQFERRVAAVSEHAMKTMTRTVLRGPARRRPRSSPVVGLVARFAQALQREIMTLPLDEAAGVVEQLESFVAAMTKRLAARSHQEKTGGRGEPR